MSGASQRDAQKQQAADAAVMLVQPNMVIGLGYGSTALLAVRQLGELLRAGILSDIVAVPCAEVTAALARDLAIPLRTLDEVAQIDLTIDGADEVDPHLNLIKGGGGALLREKMVAQLSRREVIIVDERKCSPALGTHWAVPIEVVTFGWGATARWIGSLGASVRLRRSADGSPFQTDQGNLILDCNFGPIGNPRRLADTLAARAGIVEHGLFVDLATDLIIAGENGVKHIKREL